MDGLVMQMRRYNNIIQSRDERSNQELIDMKIEMQT